MRSWAVLKKILVYSIGGLLSLFILIMVFASIFSENIGTKAIEALQSSVETKVDVKDVSISFLTFFPKAAIELNDVYIEGHEDQVLLEAENIAFKVSLFNLFSSKVSLHTVAIKNGNINVVKGKTGRWNYDIFKKDSTSSGSEYMLSINKAILEHCQIHYKDLKDSVYVSLFSLKTSFSASFSDQSLDLTGAGNTILDTLYVGDNVYFADKPLRFNLKLTGDIKGSTYAFSESIFELAGNPFEVNGTLAFLEKSSEYNLHIQAKENSLSSTIQLLPIQSAELYSQLNPEGKVDIDLKYQGVSDNKNQPELQINIAVTEASMYSRKFETDMEGVSASMYVKVQKKNTHVQFETYAGTLQDQPLELSGVVDMNKNSSYSINIDATIPLALSLSFLGFSELEKGSGDITLENVHIRHGPKYKAPNQGTIWAEDLSGRIKDQNFSIPIITCRLDQNQFHLDTIALKGFNSKISASGVTNNLIGGIFSSDQMDHRYQLSGEKLDLTEIETILYGDKIDEAEIQVIDTIPFLKDAPKGLFTLHIDLNNIKHRKLDIDHIYGHVLIDAGNIQSEIHADIFEGEVLLELNGKIENGLSLQGHLHGEDVEIETLMFQSEEFYQDFITSQHLRGTLETKILLNLYWDLYGNFSEDSMEALAAVILKDGELIRLPMMEDFSTYVKVEDLRHIKFTKLHNLFEIRKGQLYIPEMFIQSNALNLTLAGTHSFENQMDYAIQINAGQAMINRFKKANREQKPIRAKQNGFFNLHYRISGFPDNLQYGSDKKLVLKMMSESDARRDKIRKLLIDHFGPLPIFFDNSMKDLDFFQGDDLTEEEYLDF